MKLNSIGSVRRVKARQSI